MHLLVTANVAPSSPILVTLMMEALNPSETSVFTRTIRRNIPEDGIPDRDTEFVMHTIYQRWADRRFNVNSTQHFQNFYWFYI
jgi:hypothetical protein